MKRGPYRKQDIRERFFAKTRRCPDTGCLLWTGACKKPSQRDGRGGQSLPHGQFNIDGKAILAHRVAFMFEHDLGGHTMAFFGLLSHSCDTPKCVEPTHLTESTFSKNLQEAWDRGRRERAAFVALCEFFESNPMCEAAE